jgi:hypothetical protein
MNEIFKTTSYETKFMYKGKKILETVFNSEVPQSRKVIIEAIKQGQDICKKHKKLNDYDMVVSLKFKGGWRSDKIFSIYEEPILFNPEEHIEASGSNIIIDKDGKVKTKKLVGNQTEFTTFSIFLIPKGPAEGKTTGKHNDCLHYTISKILNGKQYLLKSCQTASSFKRQLNLNRDDGVPISKMPEVEKITKCNVNITGDYTYTSSNKHLRTLNMELKDGHYSIDTKNKVKRSKIIPNHKKIGFFEIVNDTFNLITEDKEWSINKNVYLNTLYPDYFFIQKKGNKNTLKEKFNKFKENSKLLFEETNGFINMEMYPFESQMAKYIYYHRSTPIPEPEEIESLEGSWIYESYQGGLMYSNDGEYKNAVCIDQNSMYSHYMAHENFYIPWKQGKFQVVKDKDLEEFIPFGIYHCVITSTNPKLNKFFRFNRKNKYTHHDINCAKLLKFKVELIHDEQSNCLMYDSSARIQGHQVYGPTINYLYELKQKIPATKMIMSSLWGSHSQKNVKKVRQDNETTEIINLDENYKIETIEKYNDCCKVKMVGQKNIFKSSYGRLGTFLTSYCRLCIVKTMLENVKNTDNIVKIHTDGWTVINEEIPKELLSNNIGKFKIEKQGNCIIENVNTVYWLE